MRSFAKDFPGTRFVDRLTVYIHSGSDLVEDHDLFQIDGSVGFPWNIEYECTILADCIDEPVHSTTGMKVASKLARLFIEAAVIVPSSNFKFPTAMRKA